MEGGLWRGREREGGPERGKGLDKGGKGGQWAVCLLASGPSVCLSVGRLSAGQWAVCLLASGPSVCLSVGRLSAGQWAVCLFVSGPSVC